MSIRDAYNNFKSGSYVAKPDNFAFQGRRLSESSDLSSAIASRMAELSGRSSLDMKAIAANPSGFQQWQSQLPSAKAAGAYNGWADSQLGAGSAVAGGGMNTVFGIMNQAGAQVAELVAQDIVNAVTQRAASYTGRGRSVGQKLLP
jgi:hypothetical protein